MRPLTFLDGGEISVRINELCFSSNAPNSIGFGLELMIHWEMCLIGKWHTYARKAMKICKVLFYFIFQISIVGVGNWSFEVNYKILCKIGCNVECYTLQGLSKIHICCKLKISCLKGSQFSWNSYAKSFIPIGSHPIIHLMLLVGLKFVFNHLSRPLYPHICTSFSFTLPRGRLKLFWITHTNADIIFVQLDAHKHLQIESWIISLRNSDLRPILRRMVLRDLGAKCYELYAYVTQWSTSWLKCMPMTLGISMLNNIFLLCIKM